MDTLFSNYWIWQTPEEFIKILIESFIVKHTELNASIKENVNSKKVPSQPHKIYYGMLFFKIENWKNKKISEINFYLAWQTWHWNCGPTPHS